MRGEVLSPARYSAADAPRLWTLPIPGFSLTSDRPRHQPSTRRQVVLHVRLVKRLSLGNAKFEDSSMNSAIERRVADRDPGEVLTPEVFALLKLCGGLRSGDVQPERAGGPRRASPPEQRRSDRRVQERRTGASHMFREDEPLTEPKDA